jgi:hypothetical protein
MQNDENGWRERICPSYFITKNNLRMTEKVKIFKEKTKINV